MIVVPVETRSRDMKPSGMADLPDGRLTDLTAKVIDSRLNVLTDHPPSPLVGYPLIVVLFIIQRKRPGDGGYRRNQLRPFELN